MTISEPYTIDYRLDFHGSSSSVNQYHTNIMKMVPDIIDLALFRSHPLSMILRCPVTRYAFQQGIIIIPRSCTDCCNDVGKWIFLGGLNFHFCAWMGPAPFACVMPQGSMFLWWDNCWKKKATAYYCSSWQDMYLCLSFM